ncbi:MAG TPA: TolC family protein, partial [Nevskiaceae bacterium]|nr:TolC family protein [Nevskiaceae bacterium]
MHNSNKILYAAWLAALPAVTLAQLQPAAGPVDLVTVSADALRANAKYNAALAAFRAQKELVPQAEGKLLPQLSATGSYSYSDETLDGDYFGPLQFNNGQAQFVNLPIDRNDGYKRGVYGATLTQTLFNLDQFYGWSEADVRVKQARYQLDAAQDELLVGVAETYFGLLQAQANERLAQAKMADLQQQSLQVRGRAGAGLATEAD